LALAAESFPNEEELWQELILAAWWSGQHESAVDFGKKAIHHHPRLRYHLFEIDKLSMELQLSCSFTRRRPSIEATPSPGARIRSEDFAGS
jgi:hypothetical protein